MILEELGVGTGSTVARHLQKAIRIDQTSELGRYKASSNENAVVVVNREQSPVEHPMRRSAQRDAISDGIGTFVSVTNRSYVGRLQLEPEDIRACLAYAHAVIAHDSLEAVDIGRR